MRSGKGFSLHPNANPIMRLLFELGPLLRESVAAESDDLMGDLLLDQPREAQGEQPQTEDKSLPLAKKRCPPPPTPDVQLSQKAAPGEK